MKNALGFAVLALTIVLLPTSSAQALTFIHEGVANGTLDAVPFGDSEFTISAVGDVRSSYSGGWYVDHTSASISIDGLGSFDFITGTRTFVNNNSEIVGFSRAGSSGSDLFNGPTNSVFSTWDMLSGIGPIVGTGSVFQWTSNPQIVTTGGILILDSGESRARFTAIVPEPSTCALAFTSVCAAIRRRRQTIKASSTFSHESLE